MESDPAGARSARGQAAEEVRRLADVLATTPLTDAELAQVTAALQGVRAGLAVPAAGSPSLFNASMADAVASGASIEEAVARQLAHPLSSGISGVFPPFRADIELPRLTAEVLFTEAYEGPPGLIHGGFLAAGFDMVLSTLALLTVHHSVTRWLRLRYLAPTFLGGPVRYELEAEEPEGRTIELRGRLLDAEGRVTMRATAQFATVELGRYADRRSTFGA